MAVEPTFIGYVPPPGSKEAGVYIYTQLDTGKTYIGSTVNGYGRFIQHTSALARNGHCNHKLQKAFNESPYFQVEFVKLSEPCKEEDKLLAVRNIEQAMIDRFEPKSNLLNIAKDVFAVGTAISPSAETRAKLSVAMKGRHVSQETRQRVAQALQGRKHTEERRQAISDAKPGRAVSIKGVVYKNAEEAAPHIGLGSRAAVRVRLNSKNFPDHFYIDTMEGNSPSL